MSRIYKQKNVLVAAQERIAMLFDRYEKISVSVSGGKDSSVLFDLAHKEAIKRNRTIEVVFIDQEAEYYHTIEIIRHIANQPNVIMKWYQIPFLMTNSVSYEQDYLHCWDGGQYRNLELNSIKSIGIKSLTWEKLLPELEKQHIEPTAQLIGLRSNESLNRYRAVTKNPAVDSIAWSSKTSNEKLINFYPIYDWGFDDIWRYIYDFSVKYNRIYDYQFSKNYHKDENAYIMLNPRKKFSLLGGLTTI